MTRLLSHVLVVFVLLELAAIPADAQQGEQPSTLNPVAGHAATEVAAQAELELAPLAEFDQRSHDEIWTISSRCVDSIHCPTPSLHFARRLSGGHWQCEPSASLFAHDPAVPQRRTVIYVHGNRTTHREAIREGLQTYDQTFLKWPGASPVRFIIWTWPSDQVAGQIRDVRKKGELADEHAFHLARLLAQFPQSNVAIISFSFGARLTLGATHLLGGGCIDGYRLPERHQTQARLSLSLVAPAIRHDCFVTTHTMSLQHTESLFLLYNTQDQYLKFYRFLRFDNFKPALGNTGICGIDCADRNRVQIEQYNAAQRVGSEHKYLEYLVDKRIEERIRENLLDHPL